MSSKNTSFINTTALLVALSTSLWPAVSTAEKNPTLPPPYATSSTQKPSKVIGWPKNKMPMAPQGYKVSLLTSLKSPRSMYVLPNGDILVSQAKKTPVESGELSPNQITLLKMNGSQLVKSTTLLKKLNLPFGMALWKDQLFVGEATQVRVFTFKDGTIKDAGKLITTLPFPKPQRHWTRHLLINSTGTKLYVSVGSVSNVGESPDPLDPRTAAILEMNLDGSQQRIYASGLRNAVSMAWEPSLNQLWAVVNERDELGDDLVPDYITHIIADGFYGWPYAYWGQHEDPRISGKNTGDLVEKTITPDFSVGAHTASLGITFTEGTKLPLPYSRGALIAQHGSWNRSKLAGYKILYVPFENGYAVDGEMDFLTGFIADENAATVYGRPVSTVILKDGTVLVTDDGAGKIWKVTPPPVPLLIKKETNRL